MQAAAAAAAAEAAAADATTAKPEEPVGLCAQAKQLLWRKPAAALYDFLAAFRTCRAYRLQFLRGFIGSLNPFGIFGCERCYLRVHSSSQSAFSSRGSHIMCRCLFRLLV